MNGWDRAGKVPRRGAGGRPRRPGVTEAILEATTALAAEGGLDDLTLNEIAERAGVGRPTIYRRWATKEALLEDVVAKMVEEHFRLPKPGSIRDELVEYLRGIIVGVQSPLRTVYIAFFNVGQSYLAADAVQRATDEAEGMVRRAIERGELRSETDPNLLLELLFGVVWYRVTATHESMDDSFAESVVDAVLAACLVADDRVGR
jgi:AcrR family transcriptional regulator